MIPRPIRSLALLAVGRRERRVQRPAGRFCAPAGDPGTVRRRWRRRRLSDDPAGTAGRR